MPSPVSFLHGDFAAATVGGVTLNIFDWTVEVTHDSVDVTAHGDEWTTSVAGRSSWRMTGTGYVTSASTAHAVNVGFTTTSPPDLAVAGYSGSSGAGTLIFAGTGRMVRGTINAPDAAMATQEFEIMGIGAPSTGI